VPGTYTVLRTARFARIVAIVVLSPPIRLQKPANGHLGVQPVELIHVCHG